MSETSELERGASAVGQLALWERFSLRHPRPAVASWVGPGPRKTVVAGDRTSERYPPSYKPEPTLVGHLRFALRYEPIHLGILAGVFAACDPGELEQWVRSEPSGAYARRAWFLFEWLTGRTLDLPDATAGAYVDALSSELQIAARERPSRRHRVNDNLLGTRDFCPLVRRTAALRAFMATSVETEAKALVDGCPPSVLARAVQYLLTKETKSSFEIERETATGRRAERFVAALRSAHAFDPSDDGSLVALQNIIVEQRYAESRTRTIQNFVGETVGGYREVVHFICPRPGDVPSLMKGWASMLSRLRGDVHPVVQAALAAFGFVFIHPFIDGNGRIHRFLVHHVLATEGFSPPEVLFPVSAAILRDRRGYDLSLESVSKAIQLYIDWAWTEDRGIAVSNDTAVLYRYFDATAVTEFLFSKVIETDGGVSFAQVIELTCQPYAV